MPNTSKQLDNIINQLGKVVGGSTQMGRSYASIPIKVDYANKQANKLKYYVAANSGGSVGSIFDSGDLTSTSDFSSAGNTVGTIVPQGIELSASNSGVYTNRYLLTSPVTDLPNWSFAATFIVDMGVGKYGVGLGLNSVNGTDKFEILGAFNCEDATADLFFDTGINGTFSNQFTGNPITIADGDSVRLLLTRELEIFTLLAYNLTTGSNNAIRYTFTPTGGAILPNISRFAIYLFGGQPILTEMQLTSNVPLGLSSLIVGDSKIAGYYATLIPLDVSGQLIIAGYKTAQLAGGGERTSDILNRIQELIDLRPSTIVLAVGSNDIRTSVPSGTWQANYANIVTQLTGAGINVVHLLPPKELSINITPLYTYINTTYSSNKIDAFTAFNTGTMLYADGIHPNAVGMDFIVRQIINSGLVPL